MLGGLLFYNSRDLSASQFSAYTKQIENDADTFLNTGTNTIRTAKKEAPYIETAVVGLGITGLVMWATYRELGEASSELLATEAALGVIGTAIAEIAVAVGVEWTSIKNVFSKL
jgi:hypothetical protein